MGSGMYGYSTGSMIFGLLLNIILIVVVVWVAVALLNKSGSTGSGDNERLTRVEKDVEEVKKMVQEIKDKLDEI